MLLLARVGSAGAQGSFYDLAASGTAQQVLAAIQAGRDADQSDGLGVTPLMAAAGSNPDPDVVLVLLAAGARVDERDCDRPYACSCTRSRSNPGRKSVRALVSAGRAVEDQDCMGETPL